MDTVTVPCSVCKTPVVVLPIAGVATGICEECAKAAEERKRTRLHVEIRQERWDRMMQPFAAYADTVFDRLPRRQASAQALRWQFGKGGLDLVGHTGTGKTRTIFLLLRELHSAGHTLRILGPGDFSTRCSELKWDTSGFEKALKAVDILVLDDWDKAILSPVQDGKFFSVFEARCAARKPILLTHETVNGVHKFPSGAALARRLRDPFLFTRVDFDAMEAK